MAIPERTFDRCQAKSCSNETIWMYCEDHAPRFRDVLHWQNYVIFHGKFYTILAICHLLSGKQIVNWWLGTDAMTLNMMPPGSLTWKFRLLLHRIKFRLVEPLISQHWVGCSDIYSDLLKFGFDHKKMVHVEYPPLYQTPVPRIEGAYGKTVVGVIWPGIKRNRKFKDWFYGLDILDDFIWDHRLKFEFIMVDGKADMREFYSQVDCVILPKRIKGKPRVVVECGINNIPVYYNENGRPHPDEILRFVYKVEDSFK